MRPHLFVAFAGLLALIVGRPAYAAAAAMQCHFANGIEHVVYIQFDNAAIIRSCRPTSNRCPTC
jgi:hypothetical protein